MIKRRLLKEERGQGVAELAVVLPVFLLLIMGALTIGLMIYTKTLVVISASQAAKVGAYIYNTGTYTEEQVKEKVSTTAKSLLSHGVNATDKQIHVDVIKQDNNINVTVTYDYTLILPLLAKALGNGSKIPLKYKCTYMIQ